MLTLVYALCILTSIICTWLLFRGYGRSRAPLLMWAAFCFLGLAFNNVLLLIDANTTLPLLTWRKMPALAGVLLLLHGLIADSK